jgi:hypothetical protein
LVKEPAARIADVMTLARALAPFAGRPPASLEDGRAYLHGGLASHDTAPMSRSAMAAGDARDSVTVRRDSLRIAHDSVTTRRESRAPREEEASGARVESASHDEASGADEPTARNPAISPQESMRLVQNADAPDDPEPAGPLAADASSFADEDPSTLEHGEAFEELTPPPVSVPSARFAPPARLLHIAAFPMTACLLLWMIAVIGRTGATDSPRAAVVTVRESESKAASQALDERVEAPAHEDRARVQAPRRAPPASPPIAVSATKGPRAGARAVATRPPPRVLVVAPRAPQLEPDSVDDRIE